MDTYVGTNKDDLFIADNIGGSKTTSSAADTLDGGKGTDDTFKLYDASVTAVDLPTLKNIENVEIYDNAAVAGVNLEKWDTVETLLLVRDAAASYILGKKVTTVNLEDVAANQKLTFDTALTAATLGVNNVTTPTAVTVAGAALKTLTVDASGKASTIADIKNGAIETLNINGKADLTLTSVAGLTAVKTIDGSKAEGKLDLDLTGTPATLKTVKTGTGDDTLALNITVADGTTIDLGAGNDKLVAGGSVATSTTTVIDGGAGIDSLDAALVNVGNSGVFKNFEILSLASASIDLDLALVNKSTFTTIAIDAGAVASVVRKVSTSQSLTVNADGSTSTELVFKDVAGTADAYTINFAKDAVNDGVGGGANTVDAGTVTINGIETVTVNSTGLATTDTNKIKLTDADAKSLVITGDKAIDVSFTAFGKAGGTAADGLGVSTIDASAATGAVTIDATVVNAAANGITIKGGAGKDKIDMTNLVVTATTSDKIIVNAGAGDDEITVGAKGGILTGGAGKDTFVVTAAKATASTEAGSVFTTITDIEKGDKIKAAYGNTTLVKTDLSTVLPNLDAAITKALAAGSNTEWFQFGSDTYLVINDTTATFSANDVVVKINGLVDLSNSTIDTGVGTLTIA